ncbi:hypothetical protein C0Q70_17767 [Pomacea canaliculata]|uniref:Uncharacterized protein n=1 Tax=Pomacea canaliculata TaxID=400727 RepID=A0A2T7NLC1_POMCA|nr:hypothetical protein C0Q70_17767 [Pomacea canaliculata]
MGVERGWVVAHHQNFHPHYHHPAHQHPPLPPPLPPPDVDSNYIHAGDDGCEKLIKLEVQEYYRLSSQEFERHALNHHHHYHLHFHPQHLHNHHPHQHQHHHPSDNNNLVKVREHFFHEAGEDSRLPSPSRLAKGEKSGCPLPPPQQQPQQQPPSSSAPYNHIPSHSLPNDVDDDNNHPSAIATAVKAFNITNGYDDSGLSKASSLGAGEDRERSPALGPIAAHTTLPSPHLPGYASYPSMSPRGQQCERGMVENAAMGPVTLAASDGDITDIGGRSSVPFDRQCVSHRISRIGVARARRTFLEGLKEAQQPKKQLLSSKRNDSI